MTLIPNRMQVITEELYNFIANMVKSTCGDAGMKYFPFIFTLFVFIVCSNVFGLFPASFTVTSHIAVTGVLALLVFAIMLIAGFSTSGIGFLGHFVPQGLPKALLPLMIPIEIISYLARPFTLALRLAANMTAGHIMLKILGGFVVMMGVVGVLPFILLVPVTALELFVALLQAYVFTILTCIYLSDSLHPHH
jgi:F-type H+-transporting ATPase subunit a